jgi:hypothetical protein
MIVTRTEWKTMAWMTMWAAIIAVVMMYISDVWIKGQLRRLEAQAELTRAAAEAAAAAEALLPPPVAEAVGGALGAAAEAFGAGTGAAHSEL